MSDLYPIWCPTCARQGECHIGDTVPKCYEPMQTEPQRDDIGNCNICKYVGLEHRCNQCVNGSQFYKVEDEPQTDCAWK